VSRGRFRPLAGALVVVLGVAAVVAPQAAAQWAVELQGGRLQGAPGAEPASNGALSLHLRHDHRSGGLRLGGGLPAEADEPYWGSAAAWHRLARSVGSFSAGVDMVAHGALLRGRDGGFRRVPGFPLGPPQVEAVPATTASTLGGQVMPLVAVERGAWRVQVRAGLAHVSMRQQDAGVDRSIPQADLQVTRLLGDRFAISPVVRRFREPDRTWTDYAGVTGVVALPALSLAATVGHWMGRGDLAAPWALSATLWPQGRVHLSASARRDSYDPLTRQADLTSWNLGVGMKLGRLPRSAVAPIATVDGQGQTVIRLPLGTGGGGPRIAGDFTNWTPVPMTRRDDAWVYTAALPAGVYQYAFVAADGTWFVPPSTPGRRDDGMGGHVAVLIVP
jgi:hypothetical protein